MLEIVKQVRAEAEKEMLLAKAKIDVTIAIEEKFLAKQAVTDEFFDNNYDETVIDEEADTSAVNI